MTTRLKKIKMSSINCFKGVRLGCLKFASKLNSKMNTPESCSFWVTDTGNISFSTQIHCFHQVLASWLSSISLLELKIFLLTTPPCHTSKVASWHVDCRYDLHFWCYLGKILSKSWKTCKKLWFKQYCQRSSRFYPRTI